MLKINMLKLGEPEFGTFQNTPAAAQIQNAMRDASHLSQELPRPRVSAGPGVPQRPSRRSEGLYASPFRISTLGHLRAVVFQDLQIANRVGK
jgi:hypothetical protein